MDIYVFGVFQGLSIQGTIKTLLAHNVTFNTLWGFDSFAGLPTESGALDNYKTNIPWTAGAFSTASLFGAATTAAQAEEKLLERLITTTGYKRIKFVRGFYNESLPALAATASGRHRLRKMQPAMIVDIDCDIYECTIEALEFMLRRRLLVVGTFVYYDDWRPANEGEVKAHHELTAKYGIKWRKLHDSCWEVLEIARRS